MENVPINNVDPVLVDVKKPEFNYSHLSHLHTLYLERPLFEEDSRPPRKIFKIMSGVVVVGVLAVISLALVGYQNTKSVAIRKGEKISKNLSASVQALKDFEPAKAKEALVENTNELGEMNGLISNSFNNLLVGSLSSVFPTLKDAFSLVGKVSELNLTFLRLTENITDLESNGFSYFQKDGKKLIRKLTESNALVKKLIGQASFVKNSTTRLGTTSPLFKKFDISISNNYVKYASILDNSDEALQGIVSLLDSKIDRHILLMFENPSEIRPGGGFLGSYGDIVINEGQMAKLEVQDIYWPDHPMNFDLKIIPPEPLQVITDDWGARDGNWFFDFPTSARTVIKFLESSKIYKEKNIRFDGAIALNINVLNTILEMIGPIQVDEYNLQIDQTNFLKEIQKEVEAGKDKKAGQNPKKILSVITPTIIERLNNLPPEKRKLLIEKIIQHTKEKDIMIFSTDQKLASVFRSQEIDGSVYELPSNFWGSYIAVVNANIGGGKSDAFIKQEINGRIDVSSDGGSFVNLKVERTHSGNNEKEWWWKADNKNYIQIFTNPNSNLVSITGNAPSPKSRKMEYELLGYEKDPIVESIEKNRIYITDLNAWKMPAFGKSVFATWFNVPSGKKGVLETRYFIPGSDNFMISDGRLYTFIFERQSGVKSSVKIIISAPLGYKWQESKDSIFVFEKENPLSRETFDLHLVKE